MSNMLKFQEEKKKCYKIPPKNVELIPWDTTCINLVGPYTVTDQKGNFIQTTNILYLSN